MPREVEALEPRQTEAYDSSKPHAHASSSSSRERVRPVEHTTHRIWFTLQASLSSSVVVCRRFAIHHRHTHTQGQQGISRSSAAPPTSRRDSAAYLLRTHHHHRHQPPKEDNIQATLLLVLSLASNFSWYTQLLCSKSQTHLAISLLPTPASSSPLSNSPALGGKRLSPSHSIRYP